jgi:hypothetical protein
MDVLRCCAEVRAETTRILVSRTIDGYIHEGIHTFGGVVGQVKEQIDRNGWR